MVMPHTIPLAHENDPRSALHTWTSLGDPNEDAPEWKMLLSIEQRTLMQLSAFRGGWTLEAAQSVLSLGFDDQGSPLSVLDVIEALLEKRLITVIDRRIHSSGRRFEVHSDIAEVAQLELEQSVDRDDVYSRHASYFLDTLSDAPGVMLGSEQRMLLQDESDNLQAIFSRSMNEAPQRRDRGLRALVVLSPLYQAGGSYHTYSSMCDEAFGEDFHIVVRNKRLHCEAYIARGKVEVETGRFESALKSFTLAHDTARVNSFTRTLAISLVELAETLGYLSRHDEAKRHLSTARAMADTIGELAIHARLEAAQGLCSLWFSPEDAERHLERALLLFKDLGDEPRVAQILTRLAVARFVLGQVDASEHCAHDAYDAAEQLHDIRRTHEMTILLALISKERGRLIDAESALTHLLSLSEVRDIPILKSLVLLALAEVHLEREMASDAAAEFLEALELTTAMNMSDAVLWAICGLGRSEAELDHLDKANRWFDKATKGATTSELLGADRCVDLCRGHLDLAHARRCMSGHDAQVALATLDNLRSKLSAAADGCATEVTQMHKSAQLRVPHRHLERCAEIVMSTIESGLRVDHLGNWFSVGLDERVTLQKRLRPRRLLMALVDHRAQNSDRGVDLDDLFHAVWPDEVATPESAANRVYVTITRLRKLGLGNVLKCSDCGFYLDPQVPLIIDGTQSE